MRINSFKTRSNVMLLWNDTTLFDNMFVLDNYVLTLLVYNKHKLNVLYELYET